LAFTIRFYIVFQLFQPFNVRQILSLRLDEAFCLEKPWHRRRQLFWREQRKLRIEDRNGDPLISDVSAKNGASRWYPAGSRARQRSLYWAREIHVFSEAGARPLPSLSMCELFILTARPSRLRLSHNTQP
jgi:hypothetical protein